MIRIGVCQWQPGTTGVAAVERAGKPGFEAIEIGVTNLEDYEQMRDPAMQSAYVDAAKHMESNL